MVSSLPPSRRMNNGKRMYSDSAIAPEKCTLQASAKRRVKSGSAAPDIDAKDSQWLKVDSRWLRRSDDTGASGLSTFDCELSLQLDGVPSSGSEMKSRTPGATRMTHPASESSATSCM